jgi:hypothetical protein
MDDVLDLSGLAHVVGIPILQARNWTSGRPIRIKPSVRAAIGKGSRNLYDETDVFKIAVANCLRQYGQSFKLIQYVLDHVDLQKFVEQGKFWLILRISADGIEHEVQEADTEEAGLTTVVYAAGCANLAIDLSSFLGDVEQRISNYMKAQTPDDE